MVISSVIRCEWWKKNHFFHREMYLNALEAVHRFYLSQSANGILTGKNLTGTLVIACWTNFMRYALCVMRSWLENCASGREFVQVGKEGKLGHTQWSAYLRALISRLLGLWSVRNVQTIEPITDWPAVRNVLTTSSANTRYSLSHLSGVRRALSSNNSEGATQKAFPANWAILGNWFTLDQLLVPVLALAYRNDREPCREKQNTLRGWHTVLVANKNSCSYCSYEREYINYNLITRRN